MVTFLNFKHLKLYTGKSWYIEYYYRIPGTEDFKRFKVRFDMNRIKNLTERKLYAQEALKFMREKLDGGFNPFMHAGMHQDSDHRILAQLFKLKTLMSEGVSITMAASYTEHYNRFEKFIEGRSWQLFTMAAIGMDQAKLYKKWLMDSGFSKKTVNASLSYMAMFWAQAIEQKWAVLNPFLSVPRLKKAQAIERKSDERFEPITGNELVTLFEALDNEKLQDFRDFCAFIYYSWARPIEISRLRVADIDLNASTIRFKRSTTKNAKADFVQIVPPLKEILKRRMLQLKDGTHFLFGQGFAIGPVPLRKNKPSEYWRETVKNKLGIDKDMYALKHTGNIEYLLLNKGNVDIKWQQKQNRHSSSAMTERYNRKLGAYFIDLKDVQFRKLAQSSHD
ncbi:MAG: tyrosine-type recombinase/integrase [Chitinophagales bacterium]|nr:tyrosine-type recombinase/integrase [Chitinophagales bacterium]